MQKIVITSGSAFTDIDTLASAIGLKELLSQTGNQTEVVLPGEFNSSITESIRNWQIQVLKNPQLTNYQTILVDISNPQYICSWVDSDSIMALYDHHFGFEAYWREKIGDQAIIKPIGACATLIWEQYAQKELTPTISTLSANLLTTAIISNTLNLKSSVTSSRDIQALAQLKPYTNLPINWPEKYFTEVEQHIFQDIPTAIKNDTKVQEITNLNQTFVIGQIELWDSSGFIRDHQKEIRDVLTSFGNPNWFMTSPSISQGINYLYTENEEIKVSLSQIINAKFEGNVGTTPKLWLRKEILRELQKL